MNEREMTDLLERATSGLDPDVARLVAGGAARGSLLRRRRRTGVVVCAGVATLCALVVGIHLTLPSGSGVPTVATAPRDRAARAVAVPAAAMADALAGLLPGARNAHGAQSYRTGVQGADVLWHGTDVSLTIDTRTVGSPGSAADRCIAANTRPYCDAGPGDSALYYSSQAGPHSTDGAVRERVLVVYTYDGYVLTVTGDRTSGRVDDDLLARLALDGVWFR